MGAIAPIDFEEGSICTHRFLEIPLWFCHLRGAMGQQNGNLHPSIRIPNDATEMGPSQTTKNCYLKKCSFYLCIYILFLKTDGFRNPLLEIDGFQGTHRTHANGATELHP